jgi:hypothetical protein
MFKQYGLEGGIAGWVHSCIIFARGILMKFRWLLVFALGVAVAKPASSQVSVYTVFSASKLTGGLVNPTTTVLYGPTIGLTADLARKKNLILSGDLRTGYYSYSNGAHLTQAAIGPKLGLDVKNFQAYAEILVGFGRYNGETIAASTDAQTEVNCGLDLRGKGILDWRVFDFGYEQYYGLGGIYNPKTFSTGIVIHLGGETHTAAGTPKTGGKSKI